MLGPAQVMAFGIHQRFGSVEALAGVDLLPDEMDEDVDTMGGLIFMLAGRVPLRGELIPHPQGHEFEVVEADPRAVKRVPRTGQFQRGRDVFQRRHGRDQVE